MSRVIDMTGKRYGSITVLCRNGVSKSRDVKWLYRCDCGEEHLATGYDIRSGKTSCCPACSIRKATMASVTHGRTNTPEYKTWTDMKTRCLNQNSTGYENYGARGIGICQQWRESFAEFLRDMGEKPSPAHSIDRIDPDGDYEPGNCRWATDVEQARNKRNSISVTIDGVTKPLVEWCEDYGCKPVSAHYRRNQGLTGEAIFRSVAMRLTFNGITDTVSGWSSRTGIKKSTICMRINKYGWSVSRALTEGAKSCE